MRILCYISCTVVTCTAVQFASSSFYRPTTETSNTRASYCIVVRNHRCLIYMAFAVTVVLYIIDVL